MLSYVRRAGFAIERPAYPLWKPFREVQAELVANQDRGAGYQSSCLGEFIIEAVDRLHEVPPAVAVGTSNFSTW